MLRIHHSLRVAMRVIDALEEILEELDAPPNLTLESYQNGREQGYAVMRDYTKDSPKNAVSMIMIAQQRNSDSIVCYPEVYDPMQSISEEAYAHARYFSPGDYAGAARWICDQLGKPLA